MAFEFAYSLDGSHVSSIKDFAADTATNYKNGVGTNGVTKGDLVYLDTTTGLVRRTINQASPKASGVVEGTEFTGLVAAGQPYVATNASVTASATNTTRYPNGVVKLRTESDSVYRVPVKSGQSASAAIVGKAYGISQDATGDQSVDLTQTTNTVVKVLDYDAAKNAVFVILSNNNTF